eukprot:925286-Rhodomonas_salina.1
MRLFAPCASSAPRVHLRVPDASSVPCSKEYHTRAYASSVPRVHLRVPDASSVPCIAEQHTLAQYRAAKSTIR